MATQSSPPPASGPPDEKPQPASAANLAPSVNEIQNHANEDLNKQSPPSVFVNSEPMREEQVQNAVKFLSHPKVRGSPVMYRRSFLERKGLTKEEIDEAFRRVPDPPPSSQATGTNQEAQVNSATAIQPSAQTQVFQPAAAAPTNTISSVGTVARYRFHWYHAVYAVGLLAASGAGTALLVKKTVIPRLKSWIRKVVLEEEEGNSGKIINTKPSLAEEAAAAAKAAAAAAAAVAQASQEMLNSKNEEKRCFEEFKNLLDVQVKEMKSMGTAIRKLEGQNNSFGRTSSLDQDGYALSAANRSRSPPVQHAYVNGKTESDSRSVRSSSPPTSTEPSAAPHPKSYMEIMAMVQRGERPPNIKDINDQPPNPNQQISNPRLAPRSKPWELGLTQNAVNGESFGSKAQENGLNYIAEGESAVPWWKQKNTRITELENDDQPRAGSVAAQPIQRMWVPPQPPPVVMPEAAEAIRRPKPLVQKEQVSEDQPSEVTDELQRVTKIAESGGEVEYNGGVSSEIKEEQELGYAGN